MLQRVFQDILVLYEDGPLPEPEAPTEADLAPLRDRIDAIDRALIAMLNERAVCANQIGAIKKRLGLPVYQPAREVDVLHNVTASNRGPLSAAAIRRLYERIIDETRSLERHLYQQGAPPEPDDL